MSENQTDEQRLLQDTVSRFFSDNYVFDERRTMDSERQAFDPAVWNSMVEMGLMGLPFPEDLGGFSGSLLDVQIVTQALGRSLVREPWLASTVLSGRVVVEVANPEQQREIIPAIASGERRLSFGYQEGRSRWNHANVGMRAEPRDGGWRLNGSKALVTGAQGADSLLLTVRTDGGQCDRDGISLFLVDTDTPGITRRDYYTIDGASASDITLCDVDIPAAALLGERGKALDGVERALDYAILALCGDAVGAMQAMLEKTIEYAKTRIAFGVSLSQQQIIRHRLVDMAVEIEHAAAISEAAAKALIHGSPRGRLLVAAAKALVGRESRSVAQWAVQLHGAIGYTDELDIGHYFRRLTQFDIQFGNRDYHLRRYAHLRKSAGEDGRAMFQLDELTGEDLAFRDEVRAFLTEAVTPEMKIARERTMWAFSEFELSRAWQKKLAKRGWAVPNWPTEYGGTGWSTNQHLIWSLESARAKAPLWVNMGQTLCAPCIMAFGSDAQKDEFLPRIRDGEDCWAQGYSEPGAGSDLANLQLRAVADGDDYILNGSKIWTTQAHNANRIFCLVRTSTEARKQQGITFLLVDRDTPGITVRPILNLAGEHDFNQVFFDDVRVPKSRRLGEEGEGWTVARHLLKFEHGGNMNVVFELESRVARLEAVGRAESDGRGASLLDDSDFELRFAEVAVDAEAVLAAAKRTIDTARSGGAPGALPELRNIRLREVSMRLTEMILDAVGPYGLAEQGEARNALSSTPAIGAEHHRMPTGFYMAQRAATIAGGTPEIHRNNLAKHLLGL
ncbi:acyl-CoA dehydrogenase family protein [Sphingobium sp. V4]|uniref:acyl-CoA dehydrogenase n=1 Tax=Sphingobium sp. V4 TaxID=3038927 RepID=UPI002557CE03|nr:acyl-CoA dehydrogenase family protein [Sphingobium sp. V4]WIW89513.1 acyl-CoA dehydrogenase family protein [Sphingobium sp. V4]